DAEQGRQALFRQFHHPREVGARQDLLAVAPRELRGELGARALALAATLVLAVLRLAHLGARRQLLEVPIVDLGVGQRGLQPLRVGPGVLGAPNAAPLAHVEDDPDAGVSERGKERPGVEAVDADRGDRGHLAKVPPRRVRLRGYLLAVSVALA